MKLFIKETADLVTFAKEIFNGKLYFFVLCMFNLRHESRGECFVNLISKYCPLFSDIDQHGSGLSCKSVNTFSGRTVTVLNVTGRLGEENFHLGMKCFWVKHTFDSTLKSRNQYKPKKHIVQKFFQKISTSYIN